MMVLIMLIYCLLLLPNFCRGFCFGIIVFISLSTFVILLRKSEVFALLYICYCCCVTSTALCFFLVVHCCVIAAFHLVY